MYLADSDRVADFLKGRPDATALFRALLDDGMAISIITFAEVYEGIYFGQNRNRHEAVFRELVRGVRVIGINRSVAREFATIHGTLRMQGQLIPPSDVFIAATAIHYGPTLVTRNVRHFQRIPGLALHYVRQSTTQHMVSFRQGLPDARHGRAVARRRTRPWRVPGVEC